GKQSRPAHHKRANTEIGDWLPTRSIIRAAEEGVLCSGKQDRLDCGEVGDRRSTQTIVERFPGFSVIGATIKAKLRAGINGRSNSRQIADRPACENIGPIGSVVAAAIDTAARSSGKQ